MIFKTDLNVHNACIIHVSCKSYFTQAKLTLLCFHQLSPTKFVLSLTCAYNTGILLGFITRSRKSWRVLGAGGWSGSASKINFFTHLQGDCQMNFIGQNDFSIQLFKTCCSRTTIKSKTELLGDLLQPKGIGQKNDFLFSIIISFQSATNHLQMKKLL